MFSIRSSERLPEFLRNQLFVCYQHFSKRFHLRCDLDVRFVFDVFDQRGASRVDL